MQLWARQEDIEGMTTPACERFHRHLANHFTSSCPHIFVFIEALMEEQEQTRLKLNSTGNPLTKCKPLLKKEAEVSKSKNEIFSGQLKTPAYLGKNTFSENIVRETVMCCE